SNRPQICSSGSGPPCAKILARDSDRRRRGSADLDCTGEAISHRRVKEGYDKEGCDWEAVSPTPNSLYHPPAKNANFPHFDGAASQRITETSIAGEQSSCLTRRRM